MDSNTISRFVQLFTLNDAEANQRVTERLALVHDDAAAYQDQYAEELAERGIEAALPAQELRDLALIDALLAEDLLWESNYQEKTAEIAEGINEILTQQQRLQHLKPTTLPSRREPGPEQLDVIQDALEQVGLALVLFALDSDAYPLSVVADAQADEARKLAKELGFELTVY